MTESHAKPLIRATGSFLSHVATLATGTAVSQAINIASILILTRLFAPEAFGLFALFMTTVSFLSVLGGARYELAIMLPGTDREAANVFYLSVFVLSGICALCLAFVGALRHPIASLFGDPSLEPWLWAVPIILFLNGLNQVLGLWCGRMKRFHQLAFSRVAQAVGTVLGQLALFFLHMSGGVALIGGWILGQSLGTFVLLFQIAARDGSFLRASWNSNSMWDLLRKYKNFPLYKAPYSFVSNASSQLVVVVIRLFSSLSTVGLFSMANRAIYMPVSLITSSMNQVFYEKAATESEGGHLEDFVNRTLRIQIVLATPLLVFAAAESRLLFSTMFGMRWAQSGVFAALLAFAGYMYFLTAWLDRLFDVRSRQRLSLILEVGGNLASLGALTIVLALTHDSVRAVAAFTVFEVIYSSVWLCSAYRVAGFRTKSLQNLTFDAFLTGTPVAIGVGFTHLFLHSWSALAASTVLVLGLETLFFLRYVHGGRAFASTAERFRSFWSDKTSALHKSHSAEFYETCAGELKALFPQKELSQVLEIGCGDGRMFQHLGVSRENYAGVDFSPQLVELFDSRHPGLRLSCAEGSSYVDTRSRYDLIFSHGVIQHFDPEMLHQHFENARSMMHGDSILICGSVLDKKQQREYESGMDSRGPMLRILRLCKSHFRRLLGLDAMGFWYRREDIAKIARSSGFETSFVQSRVYPYRFHAVLRLRPTAPVTRNLDPVSRPSAFGYAP